MFSKILSARQIENNRKRVKKFRLEISPESVFIRFISFDDVVTLSVATYDNISTLGATLAHNYGIYESIVVCIVRKHVPDTLQTELFSNMRSNFVVNYKQQPHRIRKKAPKVSINR